MKTLLLPLALAIAAFFASSAPVRANAHTVSPIGLTVLPLENIVLYDAPPNGLISSPQPRAIFTPQQNAPRLFPLQKTPDGGQYVVAAPNADMGAITVRSYVDIVQGKQVVRWVELQSADGTQIGWALQGAPDQTSPQLILKPKDAS